jgi:hypothetical protein
MTPSQRTATINRYRGILQRSEQRATEAYIAKDVSRYMVNVQKAKDAARVLQQLKAQQHA